MDSAQQKDPKSKNAKGANVAALQSATGAIAVPARGASRATEVAALCVEVIRGPEPHGKEARPRNALFVFLLGRSA